MPKAPASAPSAAAPATSAPAPRHAVTSTLSEMKIANDASTVAAGKVKFTVKNAGATVHEMVVGEDRHPGRQAADEGGLADETGSVGEVSDLAGRDQDDDPEPQAGHDALICNIAGHYMLGCTQT